MFKWLLAMTGWKALIAILAFGAVAMFASSFKIIKVIGWALVAAVGVIAAFNEIRN